MEIIPVQGVLRRDALAKEFLPSQIAFVCVSFAARPAVVENA
jgi:hypothetical protein